MWAETTSYNFGPKIYWNKIPILQEAFRRFPRAQWVWWLDLDAIIMTSSLDLHAHILSAEGMEPKLARGEFLRGAGGFNTTMTMPATFKPADANFIVDNGGWGINVGSFFMRRGGWSDWVLEMWADPLATAKDWMFPEQDGFIHMWMHHEVVRNHTALMRQRALDSYSPWNPNGANYEDGDLVVHFAGCGLVSASLHVFMESPSLPLAKFRSSYHLASPWTIVDSDCVSRNNTFCEERWHTMWDRREPSEVPAFVKEQLASGTAPIEGVQKGVGL